MPLPSVRLAEPGDAGRIAELYAQLVNDPAVVVLPERITELARDRNTRLLVCEQLGNVCGTALLSFCADAMFGRQPFAVVENVVVGTHLRGQGIGSALMRHIELLCLEADCSKIMLLSSAHREDAHRFFERAGFASTSKRGFVKYRRAFSSGNPL
ncbi:GNAT family N-acetyltransferase [Uliginosibacterium sp. H3]|uniref:GNAT family N-acetyltransferase n=1 Tax=Uliginosibacterium silvisoli TaxID=3114758 RepID=A0ABU6K3J7_9RHOO|nr:GNAT family N-acetyltransferase [Uliginosibacterium sp. H3]